MPGRGGRLAELEIGNLPLQRDALHERRRAALTFASGLLLLLEIGRQKTKSIREATPVWLNSSVLLARRRAGSLESQHEQQYRRSMSSEIASSSSWGPRSRTGFLSRGSKSERVSIGGRIRFRGRFHDQHQLVEGFVLRTAEIELVSCIGYFGFFTANRPGAALPRFDPSRKPTPSLALCRT